MSKYVHENPVMSPEITPEIEAAFWRKIEKSPGQGPKGECWTWIGKPAPSGYPRGIEIGGRNHRAHHIAMAIDGRPRPSAEMNGLHNCDHKMCVRPDHVRWGTHEENMQDHLERRPHGKRALHPDIVREIRASSERDFIIARRLGVTNSCIHNIRSGVSHKHLL